jgi:hypothetical protein
MHHHSKQNIDKMKPEESTFKKVLLNAKGTFSILYVLTNTLIGYPFLLTAALFKLIIPFEFSRKFFTKILNIIATTWLDIKQLPL